MKISPITTVKNHFEVVLASGCILFAKAKPSLGKITAIVTCLILGIGVISSSSELKSYKNKTENLQAEIIRLQNEASANARKAMIAANNQEPVTQPEVTSEIDLTEESLLAVIRLVCDRRDFDYRLAYAIAIKETGINPDSVVAEPDGTYSYGLYSFNDVLINTYELSAEDICDPVKATEWFIHVMSPMIEKYGLYDAFRAYNQGEWGMLQGWGVNYADDVWAMLSLDDSLKTANLKALPEFNTRDDAEIVIEALSVK